MKTAADKIKAARQIMAGKNIHALLITDGNPHGIENTPACWCHIPWLTDCHYAAGTLLITAEKAVLWVEKRYFPHFKEIMDTETFTLKEQETMCCVTG